MTTATEDAPGVRGAPVKDNALWQQFLEASKDKEQTKQATYKCPWTVGLFTEITEFSDMVKFHRHAAHVMLWCPAKETDKMVRRYPLKYRIPMQVRFDGKLGFPGGLVDEMKGFKPEGKNFQDLLNLVKAGLIREVEEEMTITLEAEPKYIYSSCSIQHLDLAQQKDVEFIPGYVMHFFSCEVPISTLESMEKNALEIFSSDEVLGITRVPLYFMRDNVRGLPSFLTNAFIGNALEQLIKGCLLEGFLTEEEVRFAYFVASTLLPVVTKIT